MLGIDDLKKLMNKLAPTGKYLVVDFTEQPPAFHFGKEVNARETLMVARARKAFGLHVRKLGGIVGRIGSSAAADAKKQLQAIEDLGKDKEVPQAPKGDLSPVDEKAEPSKESSDNDKLALMVGEMNVKAIKAIIDEKELDVKKNLKIADLRKAVIEALTK